MKRFLPYGLLCLIALSAGIASAQQRQAGNVNEDPLIERVSVGPDGKLYLWDKQGNVVGGWPKDLAAENRFFAFRPRLVDVDFDLKDEIVAVSQNKRGSDLILHVYKGNGQEIQSWRFVFPIEDLVETPLIEDVNHDSILDFVFASTGGERVYIHSHAPNMPRIADFRVDDVPWLTTGDPDNNGRTDLFVIVGGEIYSWDPFRERLEATPLSTQGEKILGAAVFADVNRDYYQEVIYSTSANHIVVVDQKKNEVLNIPAPEGETFASGVILEDVDLDREPEILILTQSQKILAFESNGTQVALWVQPLLYRQPLPGGGVVANDIYRGLFSSVIGFDLYHLYRNRLGNFSRIYLGENVHDFDERAEFLYAQPVAISDVTVFPLLITPNRDGVNDFNQLSYRLSEEALITLELYDNHERFISVVRRQVLRQAGLNEERFEGINTNDSITLKDDKPLDTGAYILKLVAQSKGGLISSSKVLILVNGLKAEIESPPEGAMVHGQVSIIGTAIDPNIGEGNLNADFKAYKLYHRSGVWNVSPEEAAVSGEIGSGWLPIEVPLRNQCPNDDHKESNDPFFPNSNVSCRPVQHGTLGVFNTVNDAATPNGEYTILLKTLDSNGNNPAKISYDTTVVQVHNVLTNDPALFGEDDIFDRNNPNNPIYRGPRLINVGLSSSRISRENPTTIISYALEGETSNIHLDIHTLNGDVLGPAVAVYSFNRRAEGSYQFTWRGQNTLRRNVDGGHYRIRITANAIDGTGVDINESLELDVERGFSSRDILTITAFQATPNNINPFGFGQNLLPEKTRLSYTLSKEAKVTLQVFDLPPEEGGRLQKTLVRERVGRGDVVQWDGTGANGMILPSGRDYVIRLLAEGIEIGNDEKMHQDIRVHLSQAILDPAVRANLEMLIGDGIRENFRNNGENHVTQGNSDFLWRAKGRGYLEVPFTYWLSAYGEEAWEELGTWPERERRVPVYHCGPWYSIQGGGGGGDIGGGNLHRDFAERQTPISASTLSVPVNTRLTQIDIFAHENNMNVSSNVGGRTLSWALEANGSRAIQDPPNQGFDNFLRFDVRSPYREFDDLIANCVSLGRPWPVGLMRQRCPTPYVNYDPYDHGSSGPGVFRCGYFSFRAHGARRFVRLWQQNPPPSDFVLASVDANGNLVPMPFPFAVYDGPVGSGGEDIIEGSVRATHYSLDVASEINGISIPRRAQDARGAVVLPGIKISRVGGNKSDSRLQAETVSDNRNRVAIYETDLHDFFLANAPFNKIHGVISNFNRDRFQRVTPSVRIYEEGYRPNILRDQNPGTSVYTFSNVVRIQNWDIEARYPNISVGKPDGDNPLSAGVNSLNIFALEQIHVEPPGTKETTNKNVDDWFNLRLLPEAQPKRFVEILGSAEANYELFYYDASKTDPHWYPISPRTVNAVDNDTLAHWDVTKLNGRHYTLVLRSYDAQRRRMNQDTFDIGIGTEVDTSQLEEGQRKEVCSTFRRSCLSFGPDALEEPTLVTVNAIPRAEADFEIPNGIAPIGPIYDVEPEGLEINPQRPVQLDLVFTPQELRETFGVDDPTEVTIYYLADDNILEALATVWILDNGDNDDPNDDVYRFTAFLDHFSQYLVARKNVGQFYIQAPVENEIVVGTVGIRGRVEREARTRGQNDPGALANVSHVSVKYYPVSSPLSKVEIFAGDQALFNLLWDTRELEDGPYVLLFEAQSGEDQFTRYELPVIVDNTPGSSTLFINGEVVPNGNRVLTGLQAVVEFRARDEAGIDRIEYVWDEEPYQIYAGPFTLPFEEGEHILTYRAINRSRISEQAKSATVIVGAHAEGVTAQRMGRPRLVLDGPRLIGEGVEKIWISPATQIRFSDARHIYYYFNEVPSLFEQPFTLGDAQEGLYTLTYYAADEFGRRGATRSQKLVLDKSPPITTLRFEGPYLKKQDGIIVVPETEIYFDVRDEGRMPSGRKKVEYKINNGPWIPHLGLARPLVAGGLCRDLAAREQVPVNANTDQFADGLYVGPSPPGFENCLLSWRSTDQVDNQEAEQTVRLQLDEEAPLLEISDFPDVISPNGDSRHDSITFSVWARDNFSKNISVELILQGRDNQRFVIWDSQSLEGEGPVYSLTWDGWIQGAWLPDYQYDYFLTVKDEKGNRSISKSGKIFYDRTPPALSFLEGAVFGFSPNGDDIADVLNIQYQVQDNLFNDGIQVELNVSNPSGFLVKQRESIVATPPQTHQFQWDGSNLVNNPSFDGVIRLSLVAKDRAGNISAPVEAEVDGEPKNFVVDRHPPTTRLIMEGPHHFSEQGLLWVGPNAQFRLQGTDPFPASGVGALWATFQNPNWVTFNADVALMTLPQPQENRDYSLQYYSVDLVGNQESVQSKSVRYDQTSPEVSYSIGEPKIGVREIVRISPRTPITLQSRDNEGGVGMGNIHVEAVEDRVRFGYTDPFIFNGLSDGEKTIQFSGEDKVGNRSPLQIIPLDYDATPPQTTLTVGQPNFVEDEWTFVTSETDLGFSVVAEREDLDRTEYHFKGEEVWRLSEGPLHLVEERPHSIHFRSLDVLGNEEEEKSQIVIVDNTAPDPLLTLNQGQGAQYVTRQTQVSLDGERARAGIATLMYRIDGGEWMEYRGPFNLSGFAAGPHVIEYYSIDKLGNRSSTRRFVAQLIDVLIEREDFAFPRTLVFLLTNNRRPLAGENGRFLNRILEEMGGYYRIVTDRREFHDQMRSDRFTTYIFAADVNRYRFNNNAETLRMFRELKSRIDQGEAFINMAGHAQIEGQGWQTFRQNWSPGDAQLLQSLNLVPELARQARIYSYGDGAIVEFLTNVGLLARGEQEAAVDTAVAELIHAVRPRGETLHANEVIDTRLRFTNSGDMPVSLEVEEIYPEGSRIETKATGREVDVQNRTYRVEVEALSSTAVDYLYRFPPGAGEYTLTTNVESTWQSGIQDRVSIESSYEVQEDEVEELIEANGGVAGGGAGKSVAKSVTLAVSDERENKIDQLLNIIDATSRKDRVKQLKLDEAVESVQVAPITVAKAQPEGEVSKQPADSEKTSEKVNEASSFSRESGLGSGGGCQLQGGNQGGSMGLVWLMVLGWLLILRIGVRRSKITQSLTVFLGLFFFSSLSFAQVVTEPMNTSNGAGMSDYGMFEFMSNENAVNMQNGNLVFQENDLRLPGPLMAGLYRSYNIGVGPMALQRFIDVFDRVSPHTVIDETIPTVDRIVYENASVNLGDLGILESKNTPFGGEDVGQRYNNEVLFSSGRQGWQVSWAPVVGVVLLLNVTQNSMERPAIVLLIRKDGSAEPFDFLTGESLWNKAGPRFVNPFGENPEAVDQLQNLELKDGNKTYRFNKSGDGTVHYQVYYSYPCERWGHFSASIDLGFETFSLTQTTCHADFRLPGWKVVGFMLNRMEDEEGHWVEVDRLVPSIGAPQHIHDELRREIERKTVNDQLERWETVGLPSENGERILRRWDIEYDNRKRITRFTDAEQNTTQFRYDLAVCADCPPQIRNLGWENLRQPQKFVQIDYPTGGIVRYEWFGEERPVGEANPGGNTYVMVTEFPDPNNRQVAHQKYHWVNHITQDDGLNENNQQFVQNPGDGAEEVSEERIQSTLYDLDGSAKTYVFRKIRGDFKQVRETTLGGDHFSIVKNHIWNLNPDGKRVNGVGTLQAVQNGITYTEFTAEYDGFGRTSARIDPNGLRTEYSYVANEGANMSLVREVRRIAGNARETTRYAYGGHDVCGREARDFQLNATFVERNGQEKVLKKICYDRYDNPIRELSGDAYKQQPLVQLALDNAVQPEAEKELRVYDDVTGWLIREVDKHGVTTRYSYNRNGLLTRADYSGGSYMAHQYDLANRTMTTTYFDITTARENTIVRRFNGLGRVLEEDSGGEVTRYTYTPAKQMRTMIYPDGREVLYEYDAMGRILEQTLSGHETIRYQYSVEMLEDQPVHVTRTRLGERNIVTAKNDLNGNLVLLERYSTDDRPIVTRYRYDPFGNLVNVRTPSGLNIQDNINYATGLVTRTFPGGDEKQFNMFEQENGSTIIDRDASGSEVAANLRFDPANGLLQNIAFPGQSVRMNYGNDPASRNRLTEVSDANGATRFAYNAGGAPEMIEREISALSKRFAFYQVQDSFGRIVRLIYPNGLIVYYKYDSQGRVEEVRKDSETGLALARFEYEGSDQPARITYANGAVNQFAYDIGGRIIRMETKKPDGTWIQQDEYTYDGRGRKIGVRHLDGSRKTYEYDGLNQLTAVRYFKNGGREPFQFQEYEYDPDGNRTLYRDQQKAIAYKYENGKLVGYEIQQEGGVLWQGALRYERGNMVELVERQNGKTVLEKRFIYDVQNRLVQADVNDPKNKFETTSTYQYDYTGRRESVTVDGKTTYYLYGQAGDPLMEVGTEGEVDAFYIFVGTRRLAKISGDDLDFYHQDEMDNVLKMTNAGGEEVLSVRYDPFGSVSFLSGSAHNPFLFAGKPYDQATGLIYYGGRYYDPSLGRFLSRDPMLSGINHYIYASNNPIQNKEIFGLWGFHLSIGFSFDLKGIIPGASLSFSAGPITLGISVSSVLSGAGFGGLATNFFGSIDLGPITLDTSFKDFHKQSLGKAFAGSLSRSLMKSVKLPGPLGKLTHPLMMAGGLTLGRDSETGKMSFGFKFADIGGGGNFLDAKSFLGLARKLGDFLKDPGTFFKALNFKPGGMMAEALEGTLEELNPAFALLSLGQRIYTKDFSVLDFVGSFGTIDPYSTEARLTALQEAQEGFEEALAEVRALLENSNIPAPEEDEEVAGMKKDNEEPAKKVAQNGGEPTTGNQQEDQTAKTDKDANETDPILLHNGELLVEETDLKIPGRGMDYEFKRTYHSRIQYAGPLGHNWDHNYNKRLVERENGNIARFDGDGRFDIYKKKEDGSYESPPGFFDVLTVVRNDQGRMLGAGIRDKFGMTHTYGADGWIAQISDRNGNKIRFHYEGEGSNKHLSSMFDTVGRRIVYSYNNDGRLARVSDFSGRGIGFEYDQHGDLIHVYDPLNHRVTYHYSNGYPEDRAELNHNIIRITDAKGQIYLENEYSIYDRVVRQRFGNEGYFNISYHQAASSDECTGERVGQATYRTRLRDREGNIADYAFNCQGNMLEISRQTRGLHAGEPQQYSTQYSYNEDGLVTRVIQPKGNGIEYVYDDQGNLTEKIELPTPAVGAAGPLTTHYTYHNQFSQIKNVTDPLQRETQFEVDANGNVTKKCLPSLGVGPRICEKFRYNVYGQLIKHTDGTGFVDTYAYDVGNGYLTEIIIDAGRDHLRLRKQFTYDPVGNIASFTDANGNRYEFTVDELNRVVREKSPALLNYERLFEYDDNGNLIHVLGNAAVETRYTYNELDRIVSKREVLDGNRSLVTEYQYDLNENVIRIIQPEGNSVCVAYDEWDKPRRVIKGCRSDFAATQEFDYDANGNLEKMKDGLGHFVHYEYDAFDRLAKIKDPLNNEMELAWDLVGNISSMTRRGPPNGHPEPAGEGSFLARTEFVYDNLSRLIQKIQRNEPQIVSTRYTYDNNHRVIGQMDPNNRNILLLYDGADRLTSKTDPLGNVAEYSYDGNGNVLTVTTRENPDVYTQRFEYDPLNRLVRRLDNLGHSFSYRYDSRGNLLEVLDPKDSPGLDTGSTAGNGNKTLYFYDGLNRLIREVKELRENGAGSGGILGEPVATNYEYDENGRLIEIRDDNQRSTYFAYDSLDRQIEVRLHNEAVYRKGYDANGNLAEEIQPNGYRVTSAYDAANRLIEKRISLSGAPAGREEFTYDGLSRMLAARTIDSFGNATSKVEFAYDKLNRVLRETVNGMAVAKQYDPVGNVTQRVYPSGKSYQHIYDGLDRLTQISEQELGQVLNTSYVGLDRTTRNRFGNGMETAFGYDAVKRLISLVTRKPNQEISFAFTYGYDKAGNRLYEVVESGDDLAPGAIGGEGGTVYSYDSLNRLVRSAHGVADPVAEIRQPGSQPYRVLNEWQLDGVDNWLSRLRDITPQIANDERVQRFNPNEVNEYTSLDGTNLLYDPNGNLIEDGAKRYQYNYRNLLVRVVEKAAQAGGADTEVASYGYDALGRRINKILDGRMIQYAYEGVRAIAERAPNGALREYLFGAGLDDLVAMVLPGPLGLNSRIYYYHKDVQGSAVVLTDRLGSPVEKYRYDAYGDVEIYDAATGALMEESAVGNPYLYTGQRYDAETGFYYYKARYYHPTLGRFLQRDPLGYVDGYNLYAYVNNNPLNWVDPLGFSKSDSALLEKVKGFLEVATLAEYQAMLNSNDPLSYAVHSFNTAFYGVANILMPNSEEFQEDVFVAAATFGVGGAVNYGGRTAVKVGRQLADDAKGLWGIGKRLVTKLFGKSNVETITVRHYTDSAGKIGITTSGNLRSGTHVTLPSEIPTHMGHLQIENSLEINLGRGSNYIDVEVPLSNLQIPGNGSFTSGNKWQRQLIEPVQIDPNRWRRPPGRPGGQQ